MALVDVSVSLGHLVERVPSIDDGFELPRRSKLPEETHIYRAHGCRAGDDSLIVEPEARGQASPL
jgi:hypothetical protein